MIWYPTECISFFNASFIVFLMYIFRLLWICCFFSHWSSSSFSSVCYFLNFFFGDFLLFFLRLAMCALICFSNRIAALFRFMCIVLRISFFFHSKLYSTASIVILHISPSWRVSITKSRAQIYLDSVVFCSFFFLEFRSSAMGDLSLLSWFC